LVYFNFKKGSSLQEAFKIADRRGLVQVHVIVKYEAKIYLFGVNSKSCIRSHITARMMKIQRIFMISLTVDKLAIVQFVLNSCSKT